MNRDQLLARLSTEGPWDVAVIGGGATGLGVAVDAAARGLRTVVLERSDFAAGTSSRSTKLIHGGVRYLRQGRFGAVRQALHERDLLLRNAPHLVWPLSCLIPCYGRWDGLQYALGLKLYDLLAGGRGLGASRRLSRQETLALLPTLQAAGLRGGILYRDAQFDDARLAVCLARTLLDLDGLPLNYMAVTGFLKDRRRIVGVLARDQETGEHHELLAQAVVNAGGVFCDELRQMDDAGAPPVVVPSQGVHLVFDRPFLPGDCALVIPRTDDGRVLFAIPWQGRVLVGTTDTPVKRVSMTPRPLPEEVDFLLSHAGRYLSRRPEREDIRSVFAGLRPLVHPGARRSTADIARDYAIVEAESGLLTITGGKWTTYRRMAEDTVDRVVKTAELEATPPVTERLRLHGWPERAGAAPFSAYGSDAPALLALAESRADGLERLHGALPYQVCEVIWAVRQEFARTLEDVLARRMRALFLDAAASIAIAPKVAALMAGELLRDGSWQRRQVADFEMLARDHLPQGARATTQEVNDAIPGKTSSGQVVDLPEGT